MSEPLSREEQQLKNLTTAVRKLKLQLRKVTNWNRELNATLNERLGEVEATLAEMAPAILGTKKQRSVARRKSPLDNRRPDAPSTGPDSDLNIAIP